jgi:hypothetical protein
MKRLLLLLIVVSVHAATIPGRYIVELSGNSVAADLARGSPVANRRDFHSPAAERRRAAVRAEQAAVQQWDPRHRR